MKDLCLLCSACFSEQLPLAHMELIPIFYGSQGLKQMFGSGCQLVTRRQRFVAKTGKNNWHSFVNLSVSDPLWCAIIEELRLNGLTRLCTFNRWLHPLSHVQFLLLQVSGWHYLHWWCHPEEFFRVTFENKKVWIPVVYELSPNENHKKWKAVKLPFN